MKSVKCLIYVSVTTLLCFFNLIKCSKPPHIIFIIIDDLGWNDVSFHGSKQIPTPNIDALAKDGVILNNYYVQPICTPSRGTLMTGKYPIRLGLQHDVIYAAAPWGLSPDEKILPQYLKELGYTTRGIGKWHLGMHHESYLPVHRGFDSFFGYWHGKEDFYTHFEEGSGTNGLDFHDDDENVWNYTGHYGTEIFTTKAKEIIKTHDTSKPLFLYLAHQAVHAGNSYTPLQAPPEYVNRFPHIKDEDRRIFAGMTSALDDSIGDLFYTLNESGILQNAVIVFTTDNGAAVQGIDASTGSNWPLRGSKYNMWEGGVRGVAFVWSPLIRGAEHISSGMMHISDWLPTLYSVAGGDVKKLGKIDGHNLWPTICCSTPSPRDEILHNVDPVWKVEAIRKGRYKLLKGSVFNGNFDGWFDKEGKKKANVPFTKMDIEKQKEVYAKLSNHSQVITILSTINKTKATFSNDPGQENEYCYKNNHGENSCHHQSESSSVSNSALTPKKLTTSSLEVDCGSKQENGTICEPLKASCLFDVENDPCEYNNLAKSMPEIAQKLEELLNQYRIEAVPIRNLPMDPAANPKYHGYAWVPWRSTP
ncbi:arylsulfatase B [Trichonephila inaurata madagascariensis]|uniref:Arylsulfatase B n=1 Tax=Trichonephila inaurata madagascariensis TaxID=2747483 RepID=A0A8X6XAN9_9ARAC|nr:arylsulfatase B [Trichonephila inaurata madagascariensis]